ncbi:MAG: PrsW family intramembrane metalloprotease, partial [Firmicutes bacterium]|nr:PrsW family intramembrane metalloprotease [Bacillota bacterium]
MFLFAAPSILLIVLAVLPAILLMFFIYKQDRLEKEPTRMILSLAILGVVSTFLAMITETVGMALLGNWFSEASVAYRILLYFIVVGLSEEGFKYLVLKIGTWRSQEFNCKFDGVVYAVAVSL